MGLRICVAQTPTPHHLSGSSISSSLSPSTCTHEQAHAHTYVQTHRCMHKACVYTHAPVHAHTNTYAGTQDSHMCTHKPCTRRHMCMRVRAHRCTHTHVSYLGYSVLPICLPKQFSEEFPDASFYLHSFPAEYEGP